MLKCAAVFSDGMVIQRGKPIVVFGWKNGVKWTEALPAIDEYATGLELVVEHEGESAVFTDVAVGEVFLAGGQSNMELELRNCKEGPEVLAYGSIKEDVRFYYTQKRSYFDSNFYADEDNTAWARFGDEWTGAWSAVGFFFARRIARELKCPVGIIGCNWGGTSASCWMSRDALLEQDSTAVYVNEYDCSKDIVGKSEAEQIADYEAYVAYHSEWDKKCGELYATVPGITWDQVQERLGKCRYPGPMNCGSFLRPAGLYETMLSRVSPYQVRGFIYYQGETDDNRPELYYDLMRGLIKQWRKDWNDPQAAFILTQLTMHRYTQDPDFKNWPIIREAQLKIADEAENCAAAVIIDQGEFNEIHPKYKARVGERLAAQALWKVYGLISKEEACGPVATGAALNPCKENDTVSKAATISFINCKSLQVLKQRLYGLCDVAEIVSNAVTDCDIVGFEVAAADGEYVTAEARIVDGNKILVYSDELNGAPKYVRYLWTNYSEVNLYGETHDCLGEPLPVAPFRLEVTVD